MMQKLIFSISLLSHFALSCLGTNDKSPIANENEDSEVMAQQELSKYETAYFAAGCFWCVEAIFESVEGVQEAISGYSGGKIDNPDYSKVSSGRTRHAEAVAVFYDSDIVSYETLVDVFFGSHDPTTSDQQGPDRGPQYRSVIFYQNDVEKEIAQGMIMKLNELGDFPGPIVTEVVAFEKFYEAEEYHQNYERINPDNPYVRSVSVPRLNQFKKKFPQILKEKH